MGEELAVWESASVDPCRILYLVSCISYLVSRIDEPETGVVDLI